MSAETRSQLPDLAGEQPALYLRSQKRPVVRRRALWRRLLPWSWRLLPSIVLTFVLAGVVSHGYSYLRTAPRFRLATVEAVELVNVRYASPGSVRESFLEDVGRSVFWIPLEARRRMLEEIPWVAAARVQRFLPGRLRVVLEERTPVAFLRQGNELLLVDATGVLLERPEGLSFTFPVLTGLAPGLTREGRQARLEHYLEFLRDLDASGQTYSAEVSEVDLADPEDLRVTVTEHGQAVLLHFGRGRYREKYEAYREHRSIWQQSGERVYSVDLRYRGQLVLNPDSALPPGVESR